MQTRKSPCPPLRTKCSTSICPRPSIYQASGFWSAISFFFPFRFGLDLGFFNIALDLLFVSISNLSDTFSIEGQSNSCEETELSSARNLPPGNVSTNLKSCACRGCHVPAGVRECVVNGGTRCGEKLLMKEKKKKNKRWRDTEASLTELILSRTVCTTSTIAGVICSDTCNV